jgi:hypothetical protein
MDDTETANLYRFIARLKEDVAIFAPTFAPLSDAELDALIERQTDIAADAEWQADCARAELRLRKLRAALA